MPQTIPTISPGATQSSSSGPNGRRERASSEWTSTGSGERSKATRELSKGYTILTDVTRMKAPPQDVVNLHTEAQKVVIAAGLSKTAELVGHDAITKMSVDRFSKESGMYKGTFDE